MTKKTKKLDQELDNALMDDLDRFEHFFTTYWQQIIYAALAIVLAVAVVAVAMQMRRGAKYAAEAEIANAKTVDDLQRVITKFSHLPAANPARLRLAMLYKDKSDFAQALVVLQAIIASDKANEIKWRAVLDMGYITELKGDKAAAAALFAGAGADPALPEAVRCQANYSAGRLHSELGNTAQALAALELANVKADTPAIGFWADQARNMLNRLKATAPPAVPK